MKYSKALGSRRFWASVLCTAAAFGMIGCSSSPAGEETSDSQTVSTEDTEGSDTKNEENEDMSQDQIEESRDGQKRGEFSGELNGKDSGGMNNARDQGTMGGMASHTGVGTTELADGWQSFSWEYTDSQGESAELEYALYIPDSDESLPLITYVPDATYVNAGIAADAAGECPVNWIPDGKESGNLAAFLVVNFTESGTDPSVEGSQASQIVNIIDSVTETYGFDANRLYLTGQSMGGILDFALNSLYPAKFAATVYVGCQPGGEVGDSQYESFLEQGVFADQTFVYIASAKDPKAPSGQEALMQVLDEENIAYGYVNDLDYQDISKSNEEAANMLDEGYKQNFMQFTTVTGSESSSASEHMESFEYAYELSSIYDWLLKQSLN